MCITLALNIFCELVVPNQAFALTGGPAQPEFSSFTPVGTSDMVDLSSGDMNYNIPLMDVGGYPLNIAYSSGVGMDEEASWVGLGWNLSVGQINRNVRGIPDDFSGDQLVYENYLKDNITAGASFQVTPSLAGLDVDLTFGMTAVYNSYTGFSVKPSVGLSLDLGSNASVGFNVESGPDGLCISPSVSIHAKSKINDNRNTKMTASVGTSWNSRAGMSQMTMNVKAQQNSYETTTDSDGNETHKFVGSKSMGSVGSSISFADQLYTPSKRVGMSTGSFTVNLALGSELFAFEGQGQVTAYGTVVKVQDSEMNKSVQAFGYSNTELADKYDVLDFNREKDGVFSVNATNMPITNYTYDIYNVQGQGVSGMYRPYRNQVGYVYDPYVQDNSTSGALGAEVGAGNAVHGGIDFDVTTVASHSGVWEDDNYILDKLKELESTDPNYEKVHYKNVGDLSVDRDFGMFNQTVGYRPIRIHFIGNKFDRKAINEFKYRDGIFAEAIQGVGSKIKRTKRQLRNQAIYNLTKAELDKGIGYGPIAYESSPTISAEAKPHHINEVQIIRNDGARYIYGQPAYNNKKREASFAVSAEGNCNTGLVFYPPSLLGTPKELPNDKYFNRITTPGYVHTHLLTSVLSTDYADKTGNGPSTDDYGSYTKFSYVRKNANYKWRVPFELNMATYNEGLKTNDEDNQGSYVYGEKEQYYIDTIQTKTHIAIFSYSPRKDGHGVLSESGGRDDAQDSYKLDKISLYSIEEYVDATSTPIKVVHFEYSYSLCPDVPNNDDGTASGNELSNAGGKLTLKKIYFTYRNSNMGKYTGYRFNYNEYKNGLDEYSGGTLVLNTNTTGGGTGENPEYNIKGYDTWGNYKPNGGGCGNTQPINSAEFPYTSQDKSDQDVYAAVWSMKKIHLPSGGNIDISYESDDYASVQNKDTKRMFFVKGAGAGQDGSSEVISSNGNRLYTSPATHMKYLYIEVDNSEDVLLTKAQIENKYLGNINETIYFRFLMNMTELGGTPVNDAGAKFDYVTGYCEYEETLTPKIFTATGKKYLSLPVRMVDREGGVAASQKVNPIAKAGWQFGRKYLNDYVYSSQPNNNSSDILDIANQLTGVGLLNSLKAIFEGPNGELEVNSIAKRFMTDKSWVRLKEPNKTKLGGGCRVKEIRMSDVWGGATGEMNDGLTNYQTMRYGQKYEYTQTNGLSSGVATYEPIGNKENPFVQPIFRSVKHLLAPDEENYVETPFGESFFPNPQVTYSRVTVANVTAGEAPTSGFTNPVLKKLHRTGKVVTEFYTSKDYPTINDITILQAKEDKQDALANILKLKVRKHFTASQGFVVHLNDMNGKQKSQSVYAEGQTARISGVEYHYDNHVTPAGYNAGADPDRAKGLLNNLVRVINPDGTIEMKTLGVEVDIINDFRENQSKSETMGINANLAAFLIAAFPGLVPIPLPDYSSSEDRFRSVGTTKVVNSFGILKETVAFDAGATVHTRNLAWDAVTGEVLVTETVDEYNEKYYTMNYPAHWYYKGMGQAAENLGLEGNLTYSSGYYSMGGITPYQASDFLIKGDEVYLDGPDIIGWVSEIAGTQFKLIDKNGAAITTGAGDFEVIRSGHRNLQSAGIMNVTLMKNPLTDENNAFVTSLKPSFLSSTDWADWKIINAGAVDYSQDWKVSCECGLNLLTGTYNPYVVNEKGVWRTKSSRTYLTGRNKQDILTPRREGFFSAFSPMYKVSATGGWYKDFTNWTFVAEVTKYSPYGFELENADALNRYSAAQYGYNNTFPMAVGANTQYREIGYDGFEDYAFDGCPSDAHFSFKDADSTGVSTVEAHTGKHSFKVGANASATLSKALDCAE